MTKPMYKYFLSLFVLLTFCFHGDVAGYEDAEKMSIEQEDKQYEVAVCDWMILKRQKIGAFQLAHELKSDGLELDMGSLGKRDSFDNKLREPHFQILFRDKAQEYNIKVPSIAMSGFYAQSFVGRPDYKELVEDCLNTMLVMGAKVAFLPLGVQCDLKQKPEIRPELVKRLKVVGDMAVNVGVVIGIETSLDANSEVLLLKEIDSSGIKIYYNFQNPLEAGRDLYKELRVLGKERICQIHCTDTDGVTLPDNKRIDMIKVKATLDDMGWKGWLVVERSRDKDAPHDIKRNFGTNIEYLKKIFQK